MKEAERASETREGVGGGNGEGGEEGGSGGEGCCPAGMKITDGMREEKTNRETHKHEAQRVHTTHMGLREQGVQEASRARRGEARSAPVVLAPPRGVALCYLHSTPSNFWALRDHG